MIPEGKELYKTKWLSLYEKNGYVFSHETRCDGNIVAILIFDSTKPGMVYGRYENTPCHKDGISLASITGGVEQDNVLKTCIHEIEEEAGLKATEENLIFLGEVRPSKSSDTKVFLYAWDSEGQVQGEIKGDGSQGEIGAYCKLVKESEAVFCKDPLMSTMIVRLKFLKDSIEKLKIKNLGKTLKEENE